MKYKLLIGILILVSTLQAVHNDAGTTGFTFFKLNYSARASAMANSYTGLSNDANAVFFNPAGLVQLSSSQASITYMNYFEDVHCGSAVYAFPRNEYSTIAIFSKGLTTNEERTLADEMGNFSEIAGTFGVSDFIAGISYGRYILPNLDFGVNLKYLHESLDESSASAIAFDLAIMHQTTQKDLKLGISFRNFGKQLSYYTESKYEENLPKTISAGFSYHPNNKYFLTLDVYKPLDNVFTVKSGFEYTLHQMLDFRIGYSYNSENYEQFSGLSSGLGFNISQYNMKFDYAIVSYGDLGLMHQLTLNYLFE